jgi:hypothetical protein
MFTHLLITTVMLTGTIPNLVTAAAVTQPTSPTPDATGDASAHFASEVSRRLADGWSLGVVDVLDDGSELTLEITLVARNRAEQLALVFDGDGQSVLAYVHTRVKVPSERRVYRFRDELVTALSGGAITGLQVECGSYYIEGRGGGASVDPYDYYVVTKRAKGAAAQKLFARSIAGAIEDDLRLAGVVPVRGGVDVVMFNGSEEIVHAEVDGDGRITAVEVRWSPSAYTAWERTYTNEHALAKALRSARTVESLAFDEGGDGREPRLTVGFAGGAEYVVDVADFAIDEDDMEDFGCPC